MLLSAKKFTQVLKMPVFNPKCHVYLCHPLFVRQRIGVEVEVRPDERIPLKQPRAAAQSQRGYSFFKLASFTSIRSARTPETPKK